jgi:hypothetical protein
MSQINLAARITVPDFPTRGARRKWMRQQSPELRKLLRIQANQDAGRARGKQRRELAAQKQAPPVAQA